MPTIKQALHKLLNKPLSLNRPVRGGLVAIQLFFNHVIEITELKPKISVHLLQPAILFIEPFEAPDLQLLHSNAFDLPVAVGGNLDIRSRSIPASPPFSL